MSFHGTFLRFPFAMNALTNQDLSFHEGIAANFLTIAQRVGDDEELLSFSQIMWPFHAIQGEPNYHVLIDEVGIFKMDEKLVNAPRIAQVGHILRDGDRSVLDRLELAKKILLFQHRIQLDNNEDNSVSDDEFIQKQINGIVNAGALEGFSKIINNAKEFASKDFSTLEAIYNFEHDIELAQNFINTIEWCKGNKHRWETVKGIIDEPTQKWKTEYIVQLKDTEERYKSLIQKAKELDDSKIGSQLDLAKDSADQWVVRQQKNIIEKIGKLFFGVDLIFEDIRTKNKFFLQTESLKQYEINDVISRAMDHAIFISNAIVESEQKISDLTEKLNSLKEDITNSSLSAEDRVKKLNAELMDRKMEQENKIRQLQNERDNEINEIKGFMDSLEHISKEISEQIDQKIQDCMIDVRTLHKWQMDDQVAHIPASTHRYFMPIAVGIIKDEDDEERIEIAFPSIYGENLKRIPLSDALQKFEKSLTKILDKNVKIRSNFEFTVQKKNIFNSPEFQEAITQGFDLLINKGLGSNNLKDFGQGKLKKLLKK